MAADIPVRIIIDAIDNASKSFKQVAGQAGDLNKAFNTVGIAGAALGAAAVLLGKNFIDSAGAMEQNQIAFETMIGSATRATSLLQEMQAFAKKTPFNLPELVEGGKRLLAYNVEAEDLIPTLDMLGNITAGIGKEKLPALILAFGQVKAATRLTGMELRQFSEAGVPMIDTLAKQFGVSAKEIQEMTSAGKIGFKDVEKALQSLTGEGGKFHDLMAKQSQSTLGKVSNLEDAWMRLSITMGTRMKPATDAVVDSLIKLMEAADAWSQKNPQLTTTILAVSGAIAALGAVILPLAGIIKLFSASFVILKAAGLVLSGVFSGVGTVIAGVAAAIGAPILIAVALVTAAIIGLALAWKNNWFDIQGKTKAVIDWLGTAITNIGLWFQGIPAQIMGMVTAVGLAWEAFKTATVTAFQMVIDGIVTKLTELGTAMMTFFTGLPAMIGTAIAATGAALYEFFFTTLPFAIGYAVQTIINLFTITIPMAFTTLLTWLTDFVTVQLPLIGAQIATFFTVTIPEAIGQWLSYMATAIPAGANTVKLTIAQMATAVWQSITTMVSQTIAAIGQWVANAIAYITNMKNQAIALAQELYSNVRQWISQTVSDTLSLLSQLPGIVAAQFEAAKQAAISKAKEIYEGVKVWITQVIDLFNQIVAAAQNAINKAKEAFSLGRNSARQFGGPVSSASQYVVGEAGMEGFTPQTAGYITPHGAYANTEQKGGGGVTIQFIINSDLIINSPNERRSIAEALYTDLVTLARSQNLTVAELLGG